MEKAVEGSRVESCIVGGEWRDWKEESGKAQPSFAITRPRVSCRVRVSCRSCPLVSSGLVWSVCSECPVRSIDSATTASKLSVRRRRIASLVAQHAFSSFYLGPVCPLKSQSPCSTPTVRPVRPPVPSPLSSQLRVSRVRRSSSRFASLHSVIASSPLHPSLPSVLDSFIQFTFG